MAAKRALVVDDSKSARTFLAKMLERYALEVVSVESAEQAIEYLAHHRPDAIFMDHLMPGMDGFQAVQAIKNNPRTATIPIMMYTSQEGELYLGQARALGAVGVLPKQIRPADVSKVLYELHLLPERRSDPGAIRQAGADAVEIIDDGESTAPVARTATELSMREQIAELRRTLLAALDSETELRQSEMRAALQDVLVHHRTQLPGRRRDPWPRIAAVAALIAVASLGVAVWQASRSRMLGGELAELRGSMASLAAGREGAGLDADAPAQAPQAAITTANPAAAGAAAAATAPGAPAAPPASIARPLVEVVPYGEDPLGGSRLDSLRQLFNRLVGQDYRGTVEVRVFPGRFCLT
ncbi:MAG: response regulator, partial [Steroidobacteraceae bacterium]